MIVKIILLQLLFVLHVPNKTVNTGSVSVNFEGLKSQKGYIQLNVFNNAKGFPVSEKSVYKSFQIKIDQGNKSFIIPDLPYGEYAISCYHDANKNNKLDTNFFGIPKEKVGTSNNPPAGSIPSYKDAKFDLNKNKLSLTIKFNH